MDHVAIQIPASTSNLGSGFDTLGLAVKLYTRVEATLSPVIGVQVEAAPGLAGLLSEAAEAFFKAANSRPTGVRVKLSGPVPVARGLGYSATVRVGFLAALNELTGSRCSRAALLNIAAALEHHPDNASPSIFGGFTVSAMVDGAVRCLRFAVPDALKLVTLVPSFPISTEEARKLMPSSYSKSDAAHGLNRSALITAAFSSGNLEALRGVFDDRIHQPYRAKLIPRLPAVIHAGESAGALGGFLSGSGSAIVCLALQETRAIEAAMQSQLPESEMLVLSVDNEGYKII